MNLLKISKYIICSVLYTCVLSACDGSGAVSSLISAQREEAQPLSIWADMRDGFQFGDTAARPEVAAEIKALQAHKEDFYKILQTSAPYLGYIYEEVKKRGLPAELALLPVIESECNPNARSKMGASGLWQFMPSTALRLGIKTNHAYDGRKDIIATTDAALDYLSGLHKAFEDDWLLAMAAYNWGPGSLDKAIKNQKKWYAGTSFWKLRVPAETRKYVPKILALAAIIHDPARYGFKLPVGDNHTRLASVQVSSSSDITEIMRISGASIETLHRLNPAYRTLATTTVGAPNNFLVPVPKTEVALASNPSLVDNNHLSASHLKIMAGIRLALSLSGTAVLL